MPKNEPIEAGRGSIRNREITIHVPVGLRYQTSKLFTDGGYFEVSCSRVDIDPEKALSKSLNRTMPHPTRSTDDLALYNEGVIDMVEGYILTFSKAAA